MVRHLVTVCGAKVLWYVPLRHLVTACGAKVLGYAMVRHLVTACVAKVLCFMKLQHYQRLPLLQQNNYFSQPASSEAKAG
ncbi:hypothetical protein NDU88_007080 [Pleurodeles waltl]|uniref:Secreted protein n=1 Tax=Pleurodeles waltl TaxID=8319 RepID=A0AAV7ME41_PLEWA|nr:hypothetical protein NDU88_007080 [Pleurodeles waltl]